MSSSESEESLAEESITQESLAQDDTVPTQTQRRDEKELTEIRKDALQILDVIETEYRHDLAIHLYSSFLMHTQTPLIPFKKWTAWPLPWDQVPVPSDNYVDENDITNDPEKLVKGSGELETRPDLKLILHKELNAMFSKMITAQLKEYNEQNDDSLQPVVDPPISIPKSMESKLFDKIDSMMETMSHHQGRSKNLNWRHLFLVNDESSIALQRCQELFENYDYQFEFKDDESSEEEIVEDYHKSLAEFENGLIKQRQLINSQTQDLDKRDTQEIITDFKYDIKRMNKFKRDRSKKLSKYKSNTDAPIDDSIDVKKRKLN